MARFDDYAAKYKNIRMERRDGILQITFHTEGGSLLWNDTSHRDLGYAFADIGRMGRTLAGTEWSTGVGPRLLGGKEVADQPLGHRSAHD